MCVCVLTLCLHCYCKHLYCRIVIVIEILINTNVNIMRNMLPGEVFRRRQINKCDVIAGGRSLRTGTMASVGPEVSV